MLPTSWAALDWGLPVLISWLLIVGASIYGYRQSRLSRGMQLLLISMKAIGTGLLAICLLEPVVETSIPQNGENIVVVLADNSRSMLIKDEAGNRTRFDELKKTLSQESSWLNKLDERFDLRLYSFDDDLTRLNSFSELAEPNSQTRMGTALSTTLNRYVDQPLAGVVLLTDGNYVDELPSLENNTHAVFPVVLGSRTPPRDLAIDRVIQTETNFESAPVEVTAEMTTSGMQGENITVKLLDYLGGELERKNILGVQDGKPFSVRFKLKPKERGVRVFHVEAYNQRVVDQDDSERLKSEATLLNNRRTVVVNRGRGPFRILYVTGRPNWDYKFLRRALEDDHELELTALMRLAKRKPRFAFRNWEKSRQNEFFRGFDEDNQETQEQYDEPVLIRLQTRDGQELASGFPVDKETLYGFDAIAIDDLEGKFFTEEQKENINKFVTERGGGFIMFGGAESFSSGYDRTPVGEVLPVYLDRPLQLPLNAQFALDLTREGWVQTWARLNETRVEEERRLKEMPTFKTLNLVRTFKPGASIVFTAQFADSEYPALVTQKYGAGKSAAVLIGDLWRWQFNMPSTKNDDLAKLWRQTMRWLVADVPRRIDVSVEKGEFGQVRLTVETRDARYQLTDNADLKIQVVTPSEKYIQLTAQSSPDKAGRFEAEYMPEEGGAYKFLASATFDDDQEFKAETGWVSDPDADEFKRLVPNEEKLQELATQTNGKLFHLNTISSLPNELDSRPAEFMTQKIEPWWHRWTIFLLAIGILVGEWGLRRRKGLR